MSEPPIREGASQGNAVQEGAFQEGAFQEGAFQEGAFQDDASTGQGAAVAPEAFRSVMRSLASGVTVVTTSVDGMPHGMTATAFCSVSADPPTVLVAINRDSRSRPLIARSRLFAVNILAETQRHLGDRFSSKRDDAFEGVDHTRLEGRSPILKGAAGYLDCIVIGQIDVGTHTVFFGRVRAGNRGDATPLVYHDGRYRTVV